MVPFLPPFFFRREKILVLGEVYPIYKFLPKLCTVVCHPLITVSSLPSPTHSLNKPCFFFWFRSISKNPSQLDGTMRLPNRLGGLSRSSSKNASTEQRDIFEWCLSRVWCPNRGGVCYRSRSRSAWLGSWMVDFLVKTGGAQRVGYAGDLMILILSFC